MGLINCLASRYLLGRSGKGLGIGHHIPNLVVAELPSQGGIRRSIRPSLVTTNISARDRCRAAVRSVKSVGGLSAIWGDWAVGPSPRPLIPWQGAQLSAHNTSPRNADGVWVGTAVGDWLGGAAQTVVTTRLANKRAAPNAGISHALPAKRAVLESSFSLKEGNVFHQISNRLCVSQGMHVLSAS